MAKNIVGYEGLKFGGQEVRKIVFNKADRILVIDTNGKVECQGCLLTEQMSQKNLRCSNGSPIVRLDLNVLNLDGLERSGYTTPCGLPGFIREVQRRGLIGNVNLFNPSENASVRSRISNKLGELVRDWNEAMKYMPPNFPWDDHRSGF